MFDEDLNPHVMVERIKKFGELNAWQIEFIESLQGEYWNNHPLKEKQIAKIRQIYWQTTKANYENGKAGDSYD